MRTPVLTLMILAAAAPGRPQGTLGTGDEAPAFVVVDLGGRKHSLNPVSLIPGRTPPPQPVFVIDFFATWCKPCRKLLPHLEALQKAYGDERLRVLLVDFMEERDVLAKFVKESGTPLSAVHDASGRLVARRYGLLDQGTASLPTTVVIDRNRKIAAFLSGETPGKEAALDAILAKLLGPRGPAPKEEAKLP